MKVEPQHIPQELIARDQWIVWRYETRGPQDKPTKVPYTPGVNRKALVSKPSTWRSFDDAVDALAADPHLDGLGYVLAAGDPYAGADLDHCLDLATGEVAEWALAVVEALDSYTEITPGGDGLRVWTRGTLPPGRRRSEASDPYDLELYEAGRYFTVTGRHWPGTPLVIQERTVELAAVHAQYVARPEPPAAAPRAAVVPVSLDDAALLEKARGAKNGAAFSALYDNGDLSRYIGKDGKPDISAGDLGLVNMLAFWCGGEAGRIDTLFRGSALMRSKWDEAHNAAGDTYGQMTITRALGDLRDVYTPRGDDGMVTVAKAAEILGLTKDAMKKRMERDESIPRKRTERGVWLVDIRGVSPVTSGDRVGTEGGQGGDTTANVPTCPRGQSGDKVGTKRSVPTAVPGDNAQAVPTGDGGPIVLPDAEGDALLITNNTPSWIETERGGSKQVFHRVKLAVTAGAIARITEGWPRQVDGQLFYVLDGKPSYLASSHALFAWLDAQGDISWKTGSDHAGLSFRTKEELYMHLSATSEAYEAIAPLPHEPPVPHHYYTWQPDDDYAATGEYFDTLLAYFANVESVTDRDLVKAMFCTPAWGGPYGLRPAFAIMAPDRGCGKSTLANTVGILYGGMIEAAQGVRADEELLARLLTPDARQLRVVRLDNIKGEVSSGLIEGLITADVISGTQKYKGEGRRPNTLTWILTGNGLRLSRDMAERCWVIRLSKPEYLPEWESSVRQYVETHRTRILMDILATLRTEPAPVTLRDRWMPWVSSVLCRCTSAPDAVIAQNTSRRAGHDADLEEAEMLLEALMKLEGEYVGNGWRFLPRAAVTSVVNETLRTTLNTKTVLNIIRQHIESGRFRAVVREHKTEKSRGLIVWRDSEQAGG